MKQTLIITGLLFSILISSCKDESLAGKKKELKKLNAEISEIKIETDSLTAQINKLEGVKEVKIEKITTLKVTSSLFEAFVEVQGTSQAENNVTLTTDMGGLVTAVYVDEGQYVSKGKTLIKLEDKIIRNQLQELNTSLSLAQAVFEKRERLWKKNIGSEIEFLQAKNNYQSLVNKRGILNTQLGKMSIKSPISGKVDKISLKVGELASPGMPAINVVNLSRMEVAVNIPESYLGTIKKGDKIMVEFPTLNKEIEAKVKSVSQSINRNNRTFSAIASIPNKDGLLKPNLLARIKIKNESEKNAITIPSNLLQKSSTGFYVYTVTTTKDSTNIVKETPVKIGASYDGKIVVTEGLKVDDVLINEGYRDVLNGDLIEIIAE